MKYFSLAIQYFRCVMQSKYTTNSVRFIGTSHLEPCSLVMATSDELYYRNCRLMPSYGAAEFTRRPEVATCVETVPKEVR